VIVIVVMVVAVVAMLVPTFVAVVAMFVPTFVAVVAMFVPMFVPMFVAVVAMLVTVFTIVRNVSIGVPVMPYEVDRLAAGVVLAAVMAPIALIAWAYMQIDRRRQLAATNAYAHDGRAIDEAGRRRVADIHASVKTGLAQGDGGRHLRERCAADCQRCKARGEK
jgi:hypothetical protein